MMFEKYQNWNNILTIVFNQQRMSGSDRIADEFGTFVRWANASPLRHPEDPVMMEGELEQLGRQPRGMFPAQLSAVATL